MSKKEEHEPRSRIEDRRLCSGRTSSQIRCIGYKPRKICPGFQL